MTTRHTKDDLRGQLRQYDAATSDHCDRVGNLAGVIARQLGLGAIHARVLARAARLHDIGKLDVPCHVLVKASKLTDDEWAVMHTHPACGLARIAGLINDTLTLQVVGYHHERWDGTGYPQRGRCRRVRRPPRGAPLQAGLEPRSGAGLRRGSGQRHVDPDTVAALAAALSHRSPTSNEDTL